VTTVALLALAAWLWVRVRRWHTAERAREEARRCPQCPTLPDLTRHRLRHIPAPRGHEPLD